MLKIIIFILFVVIAIFLVSFFYLFIGRAPQQKNIKWGVNFSQKFTEIMGLDWRKTYLALFEDLGVKNLKLITHWDWMEGKRDEFFTNDLDWQIEEAEKHDVKLILVIGMKTGRWPECHIPVWAKSLPKEEQQKEVLKHIKNIVLRYKGSDAIEKWQVENEPFFPFGECPWSDKEFVKKEVELVKLLDPTREVIISDSGEFSLWISAAKIGDIVGTTMYRRVWSRELKFYFGSFFPRVYYWRKAQIIKRVFGKDVICVELQAEPWGPVLLYDLPVEEQKKTMDLEQFKKNIEFAKKTGLKEFYLWGAEWWYWMKDKQNQPEIWNEAKKLF